MAGALGLTTGAYSPGDVIPSAAMNRKLENLLFPFSGGSIAADPAGWFKWQAVKIPWACDVVAVSAWCDAVVSGGSVDIYEAAASVLSAPIDLASDTHVSGTVAAASIAQDAELSLRVLAEGTIVRLMVVVTIAVD